MVNITLSVTPELKKKMDSFPEINWSATARKAIEEQIKNMEFLRHFKKDSKLTEEDAIRLGRELNKKLASRRK